VTRKLGRRAVLGSVAVMVLAAAAGTAGAKAPSASVQFLGQAQLQPNGQLLVTVDYSCSPDRDGTGGTVAVRAQQIGVDGFGSIAATCDGRKHRETFFVAGVEPAGSSFTAGSAAASATAGNLAGTATTQVVLKVK
jgi:hypothetical protein